MPRSPSLDPWQLAAAAAILLLLGTAGSSGCAGRKREPDPVAVGTRGPIRPLQPGQLRVCAFSFHSPHELAEIRRHLPAKQFELTDLTPVFPTDGAGVPPPTSASALAQSRPGWLIEQCRPDLDCDVLIYSGEFAGGFFGEQGISVTVQEMEEASCLPKCDGLFHRPREVFLLGCNTLATKGADSRSPDEYLEVLLEHDFSRADAERAVDLRYGPLGPSFKESVRRIFSGVPRLYGFATVAPRGEKTAPRLRRYFERKGDYAAYLARAGRDRAPNDDLLAAFAGMGLAQTSGLTPAEPATADRALVCALYDESRGVEQRLRIVREMFDRPQFLAFVPTIDVFLERHPPETFTAGERRAFADVQSLTAPRPELLALTRRLTVSAQKFQLATLARQLGWMSPAEYEQMAAAGVRELLGQPLSPDVAEIGCALSRQTAAGTRLRSEDIPEQLFWHAEGYRWLDCLAPADARVSARMLTGLDNIDESTRAWAAYALSRRLPLDDAVLIPLARRLGDRSPHVRASVRAVFVAQVPLSPAVLAAVEARDPTLAASLRADGKPRATERRPVGRVSTRSRHPGRR